MTYSVGGYVSDHYISANPNATSGDTLPATYISGQIVYLFIKVPADNFIYKYTVPSSFVPVSFASGELEDSEYQWYRSPIYVNADTPNLGRITVSRGYQYYTVTWLNWDGRVLYTEEVRYGNVPSYRDRTSDPINTPMKPNDDEHSYIFTGWDKPLVSVKGDVTYTAQYETVPRRYVIMIEHSENGIVTPSGKNYINRFQELLCLFNPDPGYKIKDVILNGVSLGAISGYKFSEITSNQSLRVEFEKITYSVNVISGNGGAVDILGAVQVDPGAGITVNITPDELFVIDSIKVDGVSVEITNTLTLGSITKDTLIEIAFKQAIFSITTDTSSGGTVTPSASLASGETIKVDFHAKFWYNVKDVIIDGASIGAVGNYTFVGVDRDHTVYVEYKLNVWLIVLLSAIGAALLAALVIFTILIIKRTVKTVKPIVVDDEIDSLGVIDEKFLQIVMNEQILLLKIDDETIKISIDEDPSQDLGEDDSNQ